MGLALVTPYLQKMEMYNGIYLAFYLFYFLGKVLELAQYYLMTKVVEETPFCIHGIVSCFERSISFLSLTFAVSGTFKVSA